MESTWLDDLAATVRRSRGIPVTVDDPTGSAADLGDDQRSALTALITWLGEEGRSASIRVEITTDPPRRRIAVVAEPGPFPPLRRDLDRFAVVARAVSLGADVGMTRENVSVELSHVSD